MLTATQVAEFKERGFTRLVGAFSSEAAGEMVDCVGDSLARRFGALRDDPATWTLPLGLELRKLKRQKPFQAVVASLREFKLWRRAPLHARSAEPLRLSAPFSRQAMEMN